MRAFTGKAVGSILAGGLLAFTLAGCAGSPQASSSSQSSSAGEAAEIGSSQAQSTPNTVEPGDIQEYTFDENDMKGSMESAEAFVDEYVSFAKEYQEKGKPADMEAEYTKLNSQYEDLMNKLNSITQSSYSDPDWAIYSESMARIEDKLQELDQ